MKASCTWGDGPDIMVILDGTSLVLYEGPKNPMPPRGAYKHGYVQEGSFDLTIGEAEQLGHELLEAARQAKELDQSWYEFFKCKKCDA